jgi:hypothetical protein
MAQSYPGKAIRMRNDIEKWAKVTAALKLQPG